MATKTISLEMDAYGKLRAAKRSDRESFSSVVRRARFDAGSGTGESILAALHALRSGNRLASEAALDAIEAAHRQDVESPRLSPSRWETADR